MTDSYATIPIEETNYSDDPRGPSSRGCCKVVNGNSCGSGSLVGKRNGKSLVLTNAHVAGTRIGRVVRCTFPFANNKTVSGRVILAAYSDRIMMDWCVIELTEEIDLPHVKLSIEKPSGKHYTMGYPRCRGPYSQSLDTVRLIYNGTVWQWQPDAIGGQSGSAVHSFDTDFQRGILTWSWGGNGAGQTTKSIWDQYSKRAAVGYVRPEGLKELAVVLADDLEEGIFSEANITSLPIWNHLPEDDGDEGEPAEPGTESELIKKLKAKLEQANQRLEAVAESHREIELLVKNHLPEAPSDGNDDESGDGSDCLFGLPMP